MRNGSVKNNRLMTIGLIALAIANVGTYIVRRKLALPESVADPLSGFLFGIAIATLVLGIRAQVRGQRATRAPKD